MSKLSTKKINKIISGPADYDRMKQEAKNYLDNIKELIDDFDNPEYKTSHNDGGSGHVGSIDWYAKKLSGMIFRIRQQREFVNDNKDLRARLLKEVKKLV